MSTHLGVSYFDIRCHVENEGDVANYHLIAIRIWDRHTDEVMFNHFVTFIDALLSDWRTRLTGCSTDGAASMTANENHKKIHKNSPLSMR